MPFKSKSQRRLFYAKASRGEIPMSTVKHWEEATKGSIPEKVKSSSVFGGGSMHPATVIAFNDELEKIAIGNPFPAIGSFFKGLGTRASSAAMGVKPMALPTVPVPMGPSALKAEALKRAKQAPGDIIVQRQQRALARSQARGMPRPPKAKPPAVQATPNLPADRQPGRLGQQAQQVAGKIGWKVPTALGAGTLGGYYIGSPSTGPQYY